MNYKHICDTRECPCFGQPSSAGSCRCHKTAEQMMTEEIAGLRAALEWIASQCPKENPGPAYEPGYGWKSEGNSDDKASDFANEMLWPLGERARAALGPIHASDCAIYNAPALPVGPCDCGAYQQRTPAEPK